MQEVNIYINTYHTGHLKSGTGIYIVVLEYISSKNVPYTRQYIEKIEDTTLNRTSIKSCIYALKRLIRKCKINLYINSMHVVRAITQGYWLNWLGTGLNAKGKPATNLDLWQQLYEQARKHDVNFIYQKENAYTSYMYMLAKKKFKEEKKNV